MKKYALKRLIQLVPVLIGITFLSYGMMRLAGSDAVTQMYEKAGIAVAPEIIEEAKAKLGLDQPFLTQYFVWLGHLLQGDMGTSFVSGKDVFHTFLSKLPATILLTCSSVAATVLISIPFGILAAIRQNKTIDYVIRFFSFIGNAMPNFFAALLLMYFFSIQMKLLPVISSRTDFRSIILPALTLSVSMSAKYTRQVRAVVLEELEKDYVQGARTRGIKESVILWKNVLRASMVSIITLLALSIGNLLGGAAVVENIFMWDGVGKLAADSIIMRDYPMIQAYVIWMAVIYVLVNFTADCIYRYLDPRVRLEGGGL